MRGRKRTPEPVLKIKGTFRKDRQVKTISMKPVNSLPDCPAWMNKTAKEIYYKQGPGLLTIKQLTESSIPIFQVYCQVTGKLFDLEKELETLKSGSYLQHDDRLTDRILKLEILSNNLIKNIRSLASEIGLTPASAIRVAPAPVAEESKFDQWNKKYNGVK
jgi:P27 family predicted phage terminase small subunit